MGETPELVNRAELDTKQEDTPSVHESRSLARIPQTEVAPVPTAPAKVRPNTAAVEPVVVDDTGLLRAQIEQTRAEMSETIDAIKTRLDPHVLIEEAKYQIGMAAIGSTLAVLDKASDIILGVAKEARNKAKEVGAQAVVVAKRNPVPVTVAGAAVGWILIRMWLGRRKQDAAM